MPRSPASTSSTPRPITGTALGRALGEGLRRAFADGVERAQVFVVAKGGFLAFDDGPPADAARWFDAHVVARGLGRREDLAGQHCLSPRYVEAQLEAVRAATGLDSLDGFLLDQPEVHYAALGKERAHRRMAEVFEVLERAARDGRIGCYGISSFDALRVETDAVLFQSLTSLLALAERAAHGRGRRCPSAACPPHRAAAVQSGHDRGLHPVFAGDREGNVASSIQAAHQLRVYAMASHAMGKGAFAGTGAESVRARLADLPNDAQRALQFARSTRGSGRRSSG